jgi:pyridoxal phosphate enzyme (YggS family)
MSDIADRIASNYKTILNRAAAAATEAGRSPSDVTVVAVTKYVPTELVRPLIDAGCTDLGESRPQQLWQKVAELSDCADLRWHLIGHLQRNKVARTVECADLIHSVDSTRLLQAIDKNASAEKPQDILLEVNISGDVAKHGFGADQLATLLPSLANYPHVRVRGLMAMAALRGGVDRAQQDFCALRALRDELATQTDDPSQLQELSMGMSRDFDVAIAEGATIVRVGSALFEGCDV